MSPEEVAALIAAADPETLDAKLEPLLPHLTLEVVASLKRQVDAEKMRNPGQALRLAALAEAAAARIDGWEAAALAAWASGNALTHLDRLTEALACYDRARESYTTHGRTREAIAIDINRVAVLQGLARLEEAVALADRVRQTCAGLGPAAAPLLAPLEMNTGAAYQQLGELEAALQAYARAAAACETLGDGVNRSRLEVSQAVVLEEMLRFDEATARYLRARQTLVTAGLTQEVARAELNLGRLHFRRGRYQEALTWLEAARAGFAALPSPVEVAGVDLKRAQVYRTLNLLEETLRIAGQAEGVLAGAGLRWQEALALHLQGEGYRRLGAYAVAEKKLAAAQRLLSKGGAWSRLYELDLERAEVALEAGRPAEALDLVTRLEPELDPATWPALVARLHLIAARAMLAGPPGRGEAAQLESGEGAQTEGRDEIRSRLDRALELARAHDLTEVLAQAAWLAGRRLEQTGDLEGALDHYRTSIQEVERQRALLSLDDFQLGFMESRLAAYRDAARLCRRLDRPVELLHALNLLHTAPLVRPPERNGDPDPEAAALGERRRLLREQWHWLQGQLEDTERPAGEAPGLHQRLRALEEELQELDRRQAVRSIRTGAPASSGSRPGIDAAGEMLRRLQAALEPGDLLMHLDDAEGQIHALGVGRDAFWHQPGLCSSPALERLLKAWRFHVERGASGEGPAAALPYLSRLHQALIAPLEPRLEGHTRLLLVLPPSLHDLPFAALWDGKQHLIERFGIEHLSAPEVLLETGFVPPSPGHPRPRGERRRERRREGWPLVLGCSDKGRLPLTLLEARTVAGVLEAAGPVTLCLEGAATLAGFRAAAPRAPLIHIAAHAVFRPDNPWFSWIRLADGLLTVADLYGMRLPLRPRVVLSACETGRGQPRGGGLLGMGRALLAAGASSLVVSVWRVADHTSPRLMEAFYRAPSAGLTSAEASASAALRRAQRAAIDEGLHPFHWAGFICVRG